MGEYFRRQRSRAFARFAAVLADYRMPAVGALIAIVLTLPALWVGLISDDLLQRAAIVGSPLAKPLFPNAASMFDFLDGDPDRAMRIIDSGMLPWWTFLKIKAAFWRPLTVATHWLDYRLWPNHPAIMHLHSLGWFAAFVLATGLLYRRIIGPGIVAGLATLLFAIDDAHTVPAAWLANRNIVIAGVFGVCCLLAHDRWRRSNSRKAAVFAPFLLLASLFAAEAGISTCAYLIAYALCLDRGKLWKRGLSLLPAFGVVVAWRIAWTLSGHGVADAGFYVDPLHDPIGFLVALVERAPILLLAQWAIPPAEVAWIIHLPALCAVVVIVGLAVLIWPRLQRSPTARFWAVGMILALPPMCTTFTADRMLLFVGIGAMGLMAEFLSNTWSPLRQAVSQEPIVDARSPSVCNYPPYPGRIVRAVAWGLAILHLVLSPAMLVVRSRYPLGPESILSKNLFRVSLDPSIEQRDLCVIYVPLPVFAAHDLLQREYEGQPVPRRLRVIAPALAPMQVSRPDECTLVVVPADGFGDRLLGRLFRNTDHPMQPGERLELTGLSIEIVRVCSNGMPAEAVFRFTVPLEDASLYWLYWEKDHLVPWTPPAVGQTVQLETAAGFD